MWFVNVKVATMPPKSARNWSELPSDITLDILQRVGAVDILENAQKVCPAWREICMDPSVWRVVYIDTSLDQSERVFHNMFKHVVDRSQGQLLDLTVTGCFDFKLLQYVADRSSQLRRLEIGCHFGALYGVCGKVLKKLPLLEELNIFKAIFKKEDIEVIARFYPLLKTLKLNRNPYSPNGNYVNANFCVTIHNEMALAIGKHLPGLTCLELIGSWLKNTGLEAILDGCCHLESLDLRGCCCLELNGDLRKRCSQQIKHVKLPRCHES